MDSSVMWWPLLVSPGNCRLVPGSQICVSHLHKLVLVFCPISQAAALAASQSPPPVVSPRPPEAPEPAPAERIPEVNILGGARQNEDELNRDWLDWLYTAARAAVLLTIVYFYSSFSRFVMVTAALLLVYL